MDPGEAGPPGKSLGRKERDGVMLVLTGLLGLMVAGSMMGFSFLSRKENEETDEDQMPESSGNPDEEGARGDLWDEWDDPPEAAAETGWDDMAGEVAPPAEDPAAPDWNAADSAAPDADAAAAPLRQDLSGGPEDDIIAGGGGDDVLQGLGGDDQMNGGAGDDLLVGGEGAGDLHGGAGNDTLLGGEGDDSLHGDDRLVGHEGGDVLLGGEGADSFVLGDWLMGGDAVALIADYDPAQDQIVLAYDPAAHPAPDVTVEHEGDTAHVLIDGIRIAEVAGAASLAAGDILLICAPLAA